MNILLNEIRTSLTDLESGLKGVLNITDAMETLSNKLALNIVPQNWADAAAYASMKSLMTWFEDLCLRYEQLEEWSENLETPVVVWISALFNPMSYLTAMM